MKEFFTKYITLRKHNARVAIKKAKRSKMCYAFLAPYAILFALFFIAPVVISIFFSFTYYNVLEAPRFIGLDNYIEFFTRADTLQVLFNTFVFTFFAVVGSMFLGLVLAMLLGILPDVK